MKHCFRLLALLLTWVTACASSLSTPPGNTSANARGSLLGTWNVEFRLDSVRADGSTSRWRAASFALTRGTLVLSDSTPTPNVLDSRLDVSFDSLLGRPMSCFDPRPTTTVVTRDGDKVSLRFTPHAADCGFGATATLRGDSLVGTWDESSFIGPRVMGRFRMVRATQ